MFSSEIAEQRRISGDAVDNCVQSSDEIEVVPPSPLPPSKSACIQNTSVLIGSSTALDRVAYKQKQKEESYADMEMLNDVEPDGSECSEPSHVESVHGAIVNLVDSTPVVQSRQLSSDKCDQLIVDVKPKLSASSQSLTVLQKGVQLPNSQGIADSSQTQSADVAQFNTESSSIGGNDNEIVCDVVTQSTVDQSFHSCATEDSDSLMVMVCSCLHILLRYMRDAFNLSLIHI